MANENIFIDDGYFDIVISGVPQDDLVVQRRTDGADIIPGMMVTEDGATYPDVTRALVDSTFLGLAWKHSNPEDIPQYWNNADASVPVIAFADNTYIRVILPHLMRLLVLAYLARDATTTAENDITGNEHLILANDGTTSSGFLDVGIDVSTPGVIVGKAVSNQTVTGNASDAKVLKMWF